MPRRKPKAKPVTNASPVTADPKVVERLELIALNALSSRKEWLQQLFDPRRDYAKECGHPPTISADLYRDQFDRNPIATRVCQVYPFECWKDSPTVYEDEDPEKETPFEQAWHEIGTYLKGKSLYQDEEGNPIWEYLRRVDVLSGIGHYGIMLIGIDDGKNLDEPIEGVEEYIYKDLFSKGFQASQELEGTDAQYGSPWSVTQNVGEAFTPKAKGAPKGPAKPPNGPKGTMGAEAEPDDAEPGEGDGPKTPVKTKHRILYIRCFDETLAQIVQYEDDPKSPRFGQPKMYNVTFSDPITQPETTASTVNMIVRRVHWTRVVHIADNLVSSEVIGVPRMQPVFNRLVDLIKLYGGSAEMYWQGAFPGYSVETLPQLGGDVEIDQASIRASMENYTNSLQRWISTMGMQVKSLAPQVADPTAHIEVQITAICIQLACPKRVFMGSEQGELASGQDKVTWKDRLKERKSNYLTPRVIVPFIDRLIAMECLPEPKGYSVQWPDGDALTMQERSQLAFQLTQALAAYLSGGVDALMAPADYLTKVCGFTDEQVQQMLDAVEEHMAKVEPDTADANIVPGHMPAPPTPELPPAMLNPGQKMVGQDGKEIASGNPMLPKAGATGKKPPFVKNTRQRLNRVLNVMLGEPKFEKRDEEGWEDFRVKKLKTE